MRPGRSRQPLTRDRVLQAALDLVDREGLEAVSMRRLGEALGVEAMSVYNHVPSKADVLDGVFEQVLAELPPLKRGSSWKATLRARALALADVLVKHPNALPLFATRPAVTEGAMRHVEEALSVLHEAGFGAAQSLTLFQLVFTFVVGHTLNTYGPVRAEEMTVPAYAMLDAARFPRVRAMAAVLAARNPRKELELGVDLLLDGVSRAGPRRRRSG